jgi:hypothetical protein
MDNLLEIINKIHLQKQESGKVPAFVTRKEIYLELIAQMDIELELLCHNRKLRKGDTGNDVYYEEI